MSWLDVDASNNLSPFGGSPRFAADPPSAPAGGSDGATSQLVQAMAGFGGGSVAADGLNTGPVDSDTSQQTLLTTPQHG